MQAADCKPRLVGGKTNFGGLAVVETGQFDLAIADGRDLSESGVEIAPGLVTERIELQADRQSQTLKEQLAPGRLRSSFKHCESSKCTNAREHRTAADRVRHSFSPPGLL